MSTTSASRRVGTSVRIMDITGVRPEPAVSMSSGRGSSGRVKSPSGMSRKRTSPGFVWRTSVPETRPMSDTVISGSAPAGAESE